MSLQYKGAGAPFPRRFLSTIQSLCRTRKQPWFLSQEQMALAMETLRKAMAQKAAVDRGLTQQWMIQRTLQDAVEGSRAWRMAEVG